jgi:hypothetical protein
MAKARSNRRKSEPASPDAKPAAETRIDAPHALSAAGCGEGPAPSVVAAVHAEALAAVDASPVHLLHAQAAQLADHLRRRQKDLDHREAELNVRVAQLEGDARNARLSLSERKVELDQYEVEVSRDRAQLRACLARVAEVEKAADRRREQPPVERAVSPPSETVDAREEHLAQRERSFHEAECEIEQARRETEQLREKLIEERKELEQRAKDDQKRLVARQRRELAELAEQRRMLARRTEQIDQRRAALDDLREELARMHRATLEMRLATEELWVQMAGEAPPAALTQSLGQIRARLADDHRRAEAELTRRKRELDAVRLELGQGHEVLAAEKGRVDQWARRRAQEIQEQAARLVAREQELDRQETEFRRQAEQWDIDRLGYQREIRRLRLELETAATAH